jgi:hypothetical protein
MRQQITGSFSGCRKLLKNYKVEAILAVALSSEIGDVSGWPVLLSS